MISRELDIDGEKHLHLVEANAVCENLQGLCGAVVGPTVHGADVVVAAGGLVAGQGDVCEVLCAAGKVLGKGGGVEVGLRGGHVAEDAGAGGDVDGDGDIGADAGGGSAGHEGQRRKSDGVHRGSVLESSEGDGERMPMVGDEGWATVGILIV